MITKHRISHQRYDCIVNRIQKGGTTIDFDSDPTHRRSKSVRTNVQDDTSNAVDGVRKFVVSANNLQKVSTRHYNEKAVYKGFILRNLFVNLQKARSL